MSESAAPASKPMIPPHTQLQKISMGLWHSRALGVAAELEIADHLVKAPLHVEELAALTKTHPPSLFRLLRALEGIGLFKQVSPRVFANTPVTELLRKDIPGSYWAGILLAHSPGFGEFEAMTGLLGSVQTGQIAFDRIYGCNLWEFLKRNPPQEAIYGQAMRSIHEAVTPGITAACDWSRFPVIADIGGGIGTQLLDVLSAHPSCRGILFDQPDVVQRAISNDRMECTSGSFFEQVPSGADAYILRSVIHDWADSEAIAILKTVRASAKPDARVIVIEQVIQETSEDSLTKWLDLVMMVTSGGQERTAVEYRQLLEKAGLALEKIVPTAGPFSLIFSRGV